MIKKFNQFINENSSVYENFDEELENIKYKLEKTIFDIVEKNGGRLNIPYYTTHESDNVSEDLMNGDFNVIYDVKDKKLLNKNLIIKFHLKNNQTQIFNEDYRCIISIEIDKNNDIQLLALNTSEFLENPYSLNDIVSIEDLLKIYRSVCQNDNRYK